MGTVVPQRNCGGQFQAVSENLIRAKQRLSYRHLLTMIQLIIVNQTEVLNIGILAQPTFNEGKDHWGQVFMFQGAQRICTADFHTSFLFRPCSILVIPMRTKETQAPGQMNQIGVQGRALFIPKSKWPEKERKVNCQAWWYKPKHISSHWN